MSVLKLTDAVVKAGRLIPVYNTTSGKGDRDSYYFALWVEDADGKNERCLLLTQEDVAELEQRAKQNPSNIPAKSIITDMLD